MKKVLSFIMAGLLSVSLLPTQAYAANGQGFVPSRVDTVNVNDYSTNNWDRFEFNYQFNSGPDTEDTFGVPTQTDAAARNPELENIRRNKDAALLPPAYGVFSGEIPTEASSPYHSNVRPDYAGNVTNNSTTIDSYYGGLLTAAVDGLNGMNKSVDSSGYPNEMGTHTASSGYMSDSGLLPSTSTMQTAFIPPPPTVSEITVSQSTYDTDYLLTQPNLYEDGSMGTIEIPKLNLSVKMFEGETLDSLKRGVGHFEFTSAWDGNIGVAGHNRGANDYMNGVWELENGDEIIFTSKYGRRVYSVFSKTQISDTDYSKLGWSNDNIITFITCVKDK